MSFDQLRDWLAEHGYRDQVPRRDASRPSVLFYYFVHTTRRRIGVRTEKGKVERRLVERIKIEVANNEKQS